jgi:5-methylcytosine-specific restriction endonuclease McrA
MNKKILECTDYTCFYCGKHLSHATATKDHVFPVSFIGKNKDYNIVPSCKYCNSLI